MIAFACKGHRQLYRVPQGETVRRAQANTALRGGARGWWPAVGEGLLGKGWCGTQVSLRCLPATSCLARHAAGLACGRWAPKGANLPGLQCRSPFSVSVSANMQETNYK